MSNVQWSRLLPKSCFETEGRTQNQLEDVAVNINNTYMQTVKSIDSLYEILAQTTNVDDKPHDIMQKMLNFSYRSFAFRQIRNKVTDILQQLAKLHAVVDDAETATNLENLAQTINKIMKSWDTFFYGITLMKQDNVSKLKDDIILFHKGSYYDMREFSRNIQEIHKNLKVLIIASKAKNIDQAAECFDQSSKLFSVGQSRFFKNYLQNSQQMLSSGDEQKAETPAKRGIKRQHNTVITQNKEQSIEDMLYHYQNIRKRMRLTEKEVFNHQPVQGQLANKKPLKLVFIRTQDNEWIVNRSTSYCMKKKRVETEAGQLDHKEQKLNVKELTNQKATEYNEIVVKKKATCKAPPLWRSNKSFKSNGLMILQNDQAIIAKQTHISAFQQEIRITGYKIPKKINI